MHSTTEKRFEAFLCLWARLSRLLYWRGRAVRMRRSKALSEVYSQLMAAVSKRASQVGDLLASEIRCIDPLVRVEEDYFEGHCLYLIEEVEETIRRIDPNAKANEETLSPTERILIRRADRLLRHGSKASGFISAGQPIPFRFVIQNPDKNPPRPEYPIIGWIGVTQQHVRRYRKRLESATSERDMQSFLELNPYVLIQHLRGGHGRWVLSQKRLGCQFVTDFMIAERSSIGTQWYPVELEAPGAKLFKKNGDPSSTLTHAIRQIQDWRMWLLDNIDYARRPTCENGLGMIDIEPRSVAYIIIGRAGQQTDSDNRRRRHMINQLGIQIRTFDWLLDNLSGNACSDKIVRAASRGSPRRP